MYMHIYLQAQLKVYFHLQSFNGPKYLIGIVYSKKAWKLRFSYLPQNFFPL